MRISNRFSLNSISIQTLRQEGRTCWILDQRIQFQSRWQGGPKNSKVKTVPGHQGDKACTCPLLTDTSKTPRACSIPAIINYLTTSPACNSDTYFPDAMKTTLPPNDQVLCEENYAEWTYWRLLDLTTHSWLYKKGKQFIIFLCQKVITLLQVKFIFWNS